MSIGETFLIILQLIFLEGVLSIDNAAVLGAMVSVLPTLQPIPWPNRLKKVGSRLDPILGGQRAAALKVGLLGAYLGRGLMLLLASYIIRNPWLRILGAAYLFKLAIAHLGSETHAEAHGDPTQNLLNKGFWSVVLAVELADLAFSLDNVVAAVALSDHYWIVMFGVALGIITMRFAAQLFTLMIEREPVLVPAAYVLVLNISAELLVSDVSPYFGHEIEFPAWQKFIISIATLVLALAYAHIPLLQRLLGPIFHLISRFFGFLNRIVDFALIPFRWALQGLVEIIRSLFRLLPQTR